MLLRLRLLLLQQHPACRHRGRKPCSPVGVMRFDMTTHQWRMVWWWRHVLVSCAFLTALSLVICGVVANLHKEVCVHRLLRWAKRLWRRASDRDHQLDQYSESAGCDVAVARKRRDNIASLVREDMVELVRVTSEAPPVDSLAVALRDYEPDLHDLIPAYAPPVSGSSSCCRGPSTSSVRADRPPPRARLGDAAAACASPERRTPAQVDTHVDPAHVALQAKLGAGGFGSVWQGWWQGRMVAVKVMHRNLFEQPYGPDLLPSFQQEVRLLSRCAPLQLKVPCASFKMTAAQATHGLTVGFPQAEPPARGVPAGYVSDAAGRVFGGGARGGRVAALPPASASPPPRRPAGPPPPRRRRRRPRRSGTRRSRW
jgi:hypothetical protein